MLCKYNIYRPSWNTNNKSSFYNQRNVGEKKTFYIQKYCIAIQTSIYFKISRIICSIVDTVFKKLFNMFTVFARQTFVKRIKCLINIHSEKRICTNLYYIKSHYLKVTYMYKWISVYCLNLFGSLLMLSK